MKVDVGNCAACGAKNSKFVQQCYRCGAELPWSANYTATVPQSAPPASPPPFSPQAPSWPASPPEISGPAVEPAFSVESTGAGGSASAPGKAGVPVWGVATIGVAALLLGMGLMTMMNSRQTQPPMPAPPASAVPTPTARVVAAPVQAATPKPTSAPTPEPTPIPTLYVKPGPGFSQADAMLDDRRTDATEAQKQAYWQSVTGTQVVWEGQVTDVLLTSGGEIRLRCNPQTSTSDVHVIMDGSQMGLLPRINKGQRIRVQGILQDHSMFGYTLSQGRIVGQG